MPPALPEAAHVDHCRVLGADYGARKLPERDGQRNTRCTAWETPPTMRERISFAKNLELVKIRRVQNLKTFPGKEGASHIVFEKVRREI